MVINQSIYILLYINFLVFLTFKRWSNYCTTSRSLSLSYQHTRCEMSTEFTGYARVQKISRGRCSVLLILFCRGGADSPSRSSHGVQILGNVGFIFFVTMTENFALWQSNYSQSLPTCKIVIDLENWAYTYTLAAKNVRYCRNSSD